MSGITGALPITPGRFSDPVITLIQGGKNPRFPWFGYNDASLKHRDIIPVIFPYGLPGTRMRAVEPAGGPASTHINVTRGTTQVIYRFDSMPFGPGLQDGTLLVIVHVFDSFRSAYEAMKHYLDILVPNDLALTGRLHHNGVPLYCGHYSLRTPDSVLCMRGNLFTRMAMIGSSRADETTFQRVTRMMDMFDLHVSRNMVQYSQVRRPSMATIGPISSYQFQNATFDISLKDADTLASDTRVILSNDRLISYAGPPLMTLMSTLMHRFTVWTLPANTPQETVAIKLQAAHQDTFHPGFTNYSVTVVASK